MFLSKRESEREWEWSEGMSKNESSLCNCVRMGVVFVKKVRMGQVYVSINTNAFGDCKTYSTADGQTYTPLVISLDALHKVMNGIRIVTTVSQLIVE